MNNEKKVDVRELIEKGKSKGSLSSTDIMEALEEIDYDIDQIEKIYETLETNGIEVEGYFDSAEFEDAEGDVFTEDPLEREFF